MMAIFSNMVEQIIEVFMDEFFVFETSFDDCLAKLALVLEDKLDIELGKISLHGKERYSVGAPDFRKRNRGRHS